MEKGLIVITGFMGSGKSTVARALAFRLESQMIDLDREILKQEGRSAKQIIEEQGEPSFREIETQVLRYVLKNNVSGVVALGGGAWTLPRNRDLILESGSMSVWLDAPFSLCWQRIAATGDDRPLARTEEEALTLYTERRAAYASAHIRVEVTGTRTTDEVAREIARALAAR